MTADDYRALYDALGAALEDRGAAIHDSEWYVLMAARSIAADRELRDRFPEPASEPEPARAEA